MGQASPSSLLSHDEELEELDETEEVRFKIPRSKGKVAKEHRKAESEDAAGGAERDRTDEEADPAPAERSMRSDGTGFPILPFIYR